MLPIAFSNSLDTRLRTVLRPPLHVLRGLGAWGQAVHALRGKGRRVIFLPSTGPEGAAFLRIYALAAALRPLGWRPLVLSPRLTLGQRRRFLETLRPDLVVMQGARHSLNRPALYPGQRIVYDMDDADFHLPHLAGPVAEAMGQIALVIAGSDYIADWARGAGAVCAEVVWTGSTASSWAHPPHADRGPVVAWAQSRPMTYTREAALVANVMARVAAERPGVTLRLYDRQAGDDPGFADHFRRPGLSVEWMGTLGYRDYLRSFDDVAVSLAPLCLETPFSRGKSFGKVLAALDRKVPVVGSDACEHGAFFTDRTGVITNDPARWVQETASLLSNAPRRQAMAEAAHADFIAWLTTQAAAVRLSRLLQDLISDDAQTVAR